MRTRRRGRGKRRGRRRGAPDTRAALLAAGTELFADRGYEGVSVSAIAERAGVNTAMISYHFGGKRALYREIVTTTFAEIAQRIERLADTRRPAPELLREVVAAIGDLAAHGHPHFPAMFLREVLAGGGHLGPDTLELPVRVLGAVQRIVERGVREGALRRVDPVLTHLSTVGSLVFFFATARFRDRVLARRRPAAPAPDAAAYVRHVQDLVTYGLARRPPAGRGA